MLDIFETLSDKKPLEFQPWMESGDFKFVLVTPDNITECIDACINGVNGRFALDLETTGIDNRVDNTTKATKDKIVGVCLSGDGITGWYIPLEHKVGAEHNLPWSIFEPEFRRLMAAVDANLVMAIFHNGKFDMEFLEFHGGEAFGKWDNAKRWHDTLILAYLRHSRARRKGLKALSEAPTDADNTHAAGGPGLGMKMIELKELFPPNHPKTKYDYSLVDPSAKGPLIYGCSDAICTYLLCDLLLPVIITPDHGFSQRQIYRIEKSCVIACRWMERNRLPTSPEKVMELICLGQQEWFESIMEVYRAASVILKRDVMPGYYKVLRDNWEHDNPINLLSDQVTLAKAHEARFYPNPMGTAETRGQKWPLIYDVNAPVQLGKMFDEMGVPGLVRTEKSGQIKTAKDVLEKVIKEAEARFPFMKLIKRFRETNKALSSYLFPMLNDVDPTDFTMRINFNAHKVDTGRYSTPAKERELATKKTKVILGWPPINLQSMPATYDPKRPACMTRLRECIVARPGYKIVAIDFAGEELRLVTNLSREAKWLEEFFRCSSCTRSFPRGDGRVTPKPPPARCPNCGSDKIGDLHTLTALSIYGDDALSDPSWKKLRGNAKGVNFALCYGGGGNAVVRACNVEKNEGWRIKNQFDGTYTGLKHWWTGQHKFANKHGFVLTAFGRVYPVPDIWSADGGFRSKAERNSVNGPIQGSGADVIKIAMALVYRECKKRGWLDTVRMIASMHDELVFEVRDDLIEEAIAVIVPIMTSNRFILAQGWPIPLTCDTEIGQDWTVKWDLNEMRHREVRFDGNQKVKEPRKPRQEDFDSPSEFQEVRAAFPANKAGWEALPHSFPDALRRVFKNLTGGPTPPTSAPKTPQADPAPVEAAPVEAVDTAQVEAAPVEAPVEAAPVVERTTVEPDEAPSVEPEPSNVLVFTPPELTDVPRFEPPKGNQSGGNYDFKLQSPLTTITCVKLARIIMDCRNGGTRKLRIRLPDGTLLENWTGGKGDFFVNDQQFYWAAQQQGL